ncbi:MAG TPA: glutaminyl-peptide cyclotransferase [Thermoanaerobaculia bacterium]
MAQPVLSLSSVRSAVASRSRRALVVSTAAGLALAAGLDVACGSPPNAAPAPRPAPATAPATAAEPQALVVKVLATYPHDTAAYTQGLVWNGGKLYESDGLYGSSSLREVNPKTGETLRRAPVPPGFFAEGLAVVGDRLIQLPWQEGGACASRKATFEKLAELRYEGEGWGLCDDGKRLVMSNGSSRLTFRDRDTFAPRGSVQVTRAGQPIPQLNELECVDGAVYANVWQTDQIVRIDPASGRVTATIDASGLLTPEERAKADVLNGIAYEPVKKTFLITGKLWPKMFEVVFEKRR